MCSSTVIPHAKRVHLFINMQIINNFYTTFVDKKQEQRTCSVLLLYSNISQSLYHLWNSFAEIICNGILSNRPLLWLQKSFMEISIREHTVSGYCMINPWQTVEDQYSYISSEIYKLSRQTFRVHQEVDGNVCQWHKHNRVAAQQNIGGESKAQ
jgi:hypothetical protein